MICDICKLDLKEENKAYFNGGIAHKDCAITEVAKYGLMVEQERQAKRTKE